MKKSCLLMVFLCMALLAGCGMAQGRAEQTPEDALREMQRAVAQRDREQLSRYVDLEDFLGRTYDEAGHQTAVRIGELGKRYPKDPFFWHDTAFMENYAREHREISMEFMRQILSHYFSGKEPASSYDENPTSWLSGELGRLYRASRAEVTEIRQDGKKAVVVLRIQGDESPYGRMTDGIELQLGMEQQPEGNWKFTQIANIAGLIVPVTDKAEMFWTYQGWQE
ncbi:MAG: hypothetical protein IJR38_01460 [Selenomonadaceae bacterium]|nr:hypothetical protein [Selenomonadaceae bacterium]